MIKIWTGPIRSGKTTFLINYYQAQQGVGGFLTPDREGLRELYDIQTSRFYEFETQKDDVELISIGRFNFMKASFDFAIERMRRQVEDSKINTIVIDEIGKLELKEEGFYSILVELLNYQKDLHLVVRDYLLEDIIAQLASLGYKGEMECETIDIPR